MSSEFVGTVQNVTEIPVGSTLDEDASSGASSLKPADIEEFNPDGGKLQIGDEVFTYTVDGDELDLSGTISQSYDEGEPIYTYPPTYERWAWVREPGAEEDLQVRVPHALWDRLPLGVRSEDDAEEVECELTIDGVAVISDVIAREPRVDGEFIQDYTVRPEVITDGEPPASSPTPEVSGGIGSLVVRWDAISNHDPVTYEVHLSSSSGFTPGPTTLAAEVQGTIVFLRTLPSGGALVGGTEYYVKIIARDQDGAAAPSNEASGEIVVLNTADIPSDGEVPPQVDTPSVTPGPGFLFVEWEPVENADPVAYEVHVSDNPLFDPDSSTLYATTPATSIVINKEPDGSDLDLGTPYVVSIIATDPDGAGQGSGKSPSVAPAAQITETLIEDDAISTPKLQANAIVAGKIAANAVTADTIATNAVTASKILAGAVTADKINTGAVTASKIASEAVTADKILANEALFELLQAVLLVSNKIAVPGTSGQRLEFDQDGIQLYNADDEQTANLSTQTGNAYMRGRVDFGQGSALLPGDVVELADQPVGFETPELTQVRTESGTSLDAFRAFPQPGSPGSVRVLAIHTTANTTHTIEGTDSGNWELVNSVNSAGRGHLSVYVRTGTGAPPAGLPTVTFGTVSDWRMIAYEFVGLEVGEDEDVAATGSGNLTSISIGPTSSTTQTHELVLGFVVAANAVAFPTGWNVPPAFVTRGGVDLNGFHKNVTTTGAQSLTTTQGASGAWLGAVAAFKCRAATGAPVAPDTGRVRLYSAAGELYWIDSDGVEHKIATE